MAITATFQADFTQFVGGVQQAEQKLGDLQAGAGKIPPVMQQITGAAGSTTTALGGFHQGLSSVDRMLASVGIQIGPQVRALHELAAASGKTASQLGLVATAGVTVAAAMGGWQIGRMVADWFNLDEAIGEATASLLGWGSVAGEVAEHKMDVLARASGIAKREITDFKEALRIIKDETDRFSETMNTSTHRVSLWQGEIRDLRAKGTLDNLKADMEAGNSTLKELSKHYDISTRAIEYFGRQNKETAEFIKLNKEETDKLTAAVDKNATAYRKFLNEIGVQEIQDHAEVLKEKEKMDTAYRKFLNEIGVQELEDAKTMWDSVKEYSNSSLQATADKAKAAYDYVAARAEEFAPKVIEQFRLAAEAAAATAGEIHGIGNALAGLTIIGQKPGSSLNPEKPSGVTVFGGGGGPGISGADLSLYGASLRTAFNPGLRTSDVMSPFGQGGSVVINNTINAQGAFLNTPADQQRLAEKVGGAVRDQLMSHGRQVA